MSQIVKTVKTIDIRSVRPTEVVVKYKVRKMTKSLSNTIVIVQFIDVDHQNSCLFTNKGHFSPLLWVLIGVLDKFHE